MASAAGCIRAQWKGALTGSKERTFARAAFLGHGGHRAFDGGLVRRRSPPGRGRCRWQRPRPRPGPRVSPRRAPRPALSVGSYADLAVLTDDYFSVPTDEIRRIESVLTMVGGRVVYGRDAYAALSPDLPPVSPDWSPFVTTAATRTRGRPPQSTSTFRSWRQTGESGRPVAVAGFDSLRSLSCLQG